jgi:hypothetical protein
MAKHLIAALSALAFVPQLAGAFEITGASIGLNYSTFAEDGMRDTNKASLGGSLEAAITPSFSIQTDIASHHFGFLDDSGQSFAAHGIYHMSNGAAIGGFAGRDWMAGNNIDLWGVEARNSFGMIDVEGNLTFLDSDSGRGNSVGLRGDYALSDQFSFGGRFDYVDDGSETLTRVGAIADFAPQNGMVLTGEIGAADLPNDNVEPYVGLGVKMTFGGNRGTTFGSRGLQDLLPGY